MFFVLVILAVFGVLAYRATTAEDRARFVDEVVQPTLAKMDRVVFAAEPFRATLCARTPRLVLTPVLVGLNLLMFVAMLFGDGAFGDLTTLLDWGANYGPRTTNGEWWRVLTALFVQGGPTHLVFVLIGLVQVCELLERLVGAAVVGWVYVAAGAIAGLVSLVDHPLALHTGASAAVYGLYGLLLAVTLWGAIRGGRLAIPLPVFQLLIPCTALFFLYSLVTDGLASRPNLTGLVVGVVGGLVLTGNYEERKASWRPLAITVATAVAIAGAVAWPLRGIVDVRPDLVDLVAREDREAFVFQFTVNRFTSSQRPIDRRVLAGLIDRTILPQIVEARTRIGALDNALADHQPLVATAAEYLRLREESWRLRVEGLREGKMDVLRKADRIEMASRAALEKLRVISVNIDIYT